MKIIIERNQSENQSPIVTIDTKTCDYPYAIRNAIKLALEIDGYSEGRINAVFNIHPDNEEALTPKRDE